MKHYYRIGEIVELYGVGPDSLRYYEKLGILKPHRGENNYRMYHIHDLWRLNVIRDLRELGFSMAQIQEYLEHRSLDSTEELLTRELSVIEKRMRALENLKSNIEDRLDVLKEIRTQPLGVIEQKYIGRRHCYTIPSGYQIDEEMDMLIKQLVNKDPDKLYISATTGSAQSFPCPAPEPAITGIIPRSLLLKKAETKSSRKASISPSAMTAAVPGMKLTSPLSFPMQKNTGSRPQALSWSFCWLTSTRRMTCRSAGQSCRFSARPASWICPHIH